MEKAQQWHLSKSLPATFILAIVIQTLGLVWYMSTLDSNVTLNAREIARHEIRINEIEKTSQMQAVMLGRIDENIKAIREAVVNMQKFNPSAK
jgi:Tfp pilus assembly protein PilO|tara:strand:- start:257 stop:535 length:279 start_codon:yes stop_codon:yes gene_type:complete